jgi:hypothetical protein
VSDSWPLASKFPKVDIVLHCSDLAKVASLSESKQALGMLGSINAELKLVNAGNHGISLNGSFAKGAGVINLQEGADHFTLKNSQERLLISHIRLCVPIPVRELDFG